MNSLILKAPICTGKHMHLMWQTDLFKGFVVLEHMILQFQCMNKKICVLVSIILLVIVITPLNLTYLFVFKDLRLLWCTWFNALNTYKRPCGRNKTIFSKSPVLIWDDENNHLKSPKEVLHLSSSIMTTTESEMEVIENDSPSTTKSLLELLDIIYLDTTPTVDDSVCKLVSNSEWFINYFFPQCFHCFLLGSVCFV